MLQSVGIRGLPVIGSQHNLAVLLWYQLKYTEAEELFGKALQLVDALIDHFTGKQARLPCIWKENCSNQFISVDSKGTVAQCDCWVTSYPDYFFGNIFREPDLTRMLKTSRARQDFVQRPKRLVEDEDCLSCRYLSICHGGCPVRTYSALGTMMAKDPYCEVYKAVFARAEAYGLEILRSRSPLRIAVRRDHANAEHRTGSSSTAV